jgi:tetratricopeptide (TPR) repeat protein
MIDERTPVLIAGGLPASGLPTTGERPALAVQAQALAREQGALLIAWPRWGAAVITPVAPPLGLVAGGLGLLLPPEELVLPPEQAAGVARALAALLDRPSPQAAQAALAALAPIATAEAELWRLVAAGWAAALAGVWEQLEQAIQQAYALADRQKLPQLTRAGALFALAVLELEAGEPAGQAVVWLDQAVSLFTRLGRTAQSALARWARAQALERQGLAAEARREAAGALQLVDPACAPAVYALVLAGIANMQLAQAATPGAAQTAGAQLAEAAQRCPAETNPLLAARLLAGLGDACQAAARDAVELRRALECYQRAAQLFRRSGTPEDLAAVQMNEGSAWQGLEGDTRGNLLKAVNCYQQALRVFALATHPAEYALIHNNLATAYLKLPMSDERDIMRQALAVQSMQEALKVYTLEEYPREYAMVQNNLGNALQYLPSGDRAEKLDRAIEAYHEALRVRSRPRAPVEYAVTISNLANAYANLPAEDRKQALELAQRCYGEALEIFRAHRLDDQARTVEQALALVQGDAAGGRELSINGA